MSEKMPGRSMTTEEIGEYCRQVLLSDPAGNEAAGRLMLEKLSSGVRVEGGPVRGLYVPKVLSSRAAVIMKNAGEMTARICEKAIRRYWESAEFRKRFAFDEKLEKLACHDPGYRTLLPILRVDIFYDESTGDFRFCELNTDGTSGMIEDRELNRVFRNTPLFRKLGEAGDIESFELFDTLAQRYAGIYEETEKGREAMRISRTGGRRPTAAVVDFLECASSLDEFEEYRRSFEKCGMEAVIADIRNLRFDGSRLLCRGGKMSEDGKLIYGGEKPVDLIYRRAVTSDILSHPEESAALEKAYLAGAVCLLGGFCTQTVHDKAFFTAIADGSSESFLTPEEREFLHRHLPFTADASSVTSEGLIRESGSTAEMRKVTGSARRDWVLKPRSAYGSRGIFIGRECTEEEWEQQLADARRGDVLLQQFIEPYESPNIDYAEEHPAVRNYRNTTGIYVFGGRFAGIYSRASESRIISTSRGGFDLASCVLKE